MELKQLYYFKAVADAGTISAAARKLNMSQPPLSSQMQLLEQELGCVLFERGSRKIQLTEAGRIFYERAGAMLELAQTTAQEMQDYRQGNAGTLRLGVVSSVGALLLKKWIVPFHKKFPQIRYEIYEGNTYQILEQVRANRIEVGLVRTPFSGEGLEAVKLAREPMLAAGHAGFFTGTAKGEQDLGMEVSLNENGTARSSMSGICGVVAIQELAGQPLIIYRRWEQILTERFAHAGVQPVCFCKNDDARTSLEWAMSGMGIAIFPASAGGMLDGKEKSGIQVYRIGDVGLESEICAVYNPHAYLSMAARTLIDGMKLSV
ncbi:MAG: LysR family transcriptional regulator [Candidatus Limivivens sp.]|nr:LysR family transcriptional regulator [Candidatus Limivivens sp.]